MRLHRWWTLPSSVSVLGTCVDRATLWLMPLRCAWSGLPGRCGSTSDLAIQRPVLGCGRSQLNQGARPPPSIRRSEGHRLRSLRAGRRPGLRITGGVRTAVSWSVEYSCSTGMSLATTGVRAHRLQDDEPQPSFTEGRPTRPRCGSTRAARCRSRSARMTSRPSSRPSSGSGQASSRCCHSPGTVTADDHERRARWSRLETIAIAGTTTLPLRGSMPPTAGR
jgi:hypothetical protein